MEISMQSPSVSVVIPAYNAAHFVVDAIRSALNQTYEISEIIVVDDGSSDNTCEVAASISGARVIRRANGGPGAARNTGVAAASGEWIAFLDSDDLWLPRKTEIQMSLVTPEAGVIHSNRFDSIYFGNLWHRQVHVTPSGAIVRKQTLVEVGGFEESRSIIGVEDVNVWLKIALTDWRFVKSEGDLFGYRPTPQSLTGNDLKMARSELANITMVGDLVKCQAEEIDRVKQASKIEYAKGLIAGRRWDEAAQLLQECTPGYASRWLTLARVLKVSRLARTNFVRWLQTIDGRYESHMCSGECNLKEVIRNRCMDSCRKAYFCPPADV
jgi:glycosyltransferase involved in cell wall biosynthesis